MRKLIFVLLLCLATSSFGQFAPQQKPVLGTQINWARTHGLVVCLLMNEGFGNKVYNIAGSGDADFTNDPAWVGGKFGSCLVLDGGDDYLSIDRTKITPIDGNYTIIAWIKLNAVGAAQTIASKRVSGGTLFNFFFYITSSNQLWNGVGAYNTEAYLSSPTLAISTWYQVVAVFDGTKSRLYINGLEGTYGAQDVQTAQSWTVVDWDVVIGRNHAWGEYLNADVDHVMIYNVSLSSGEIAQLYQEPFYIFEPSFNWFLYGGIAVPTVGGQVIFVNVN